MSGTFEHIGEMENIINQSRLNQRSLVITLIDLRNAFGSVNHHRHLIQTVLKYHHIPSNISDIIGSLYNSFHISSLTKNSNIKLLGYGHRFKHIIKIWSNGHGLLEDFIQLITLHIFLYDMCSLENFSFSAFSRGIQLERLNTFDGFFGERTFRK